MKRNFGNHLKLPRIRIFFIKFMHRTGGRLCVLNLSMFTVPRWSPILFLFTADELPSRVSWCPHRSHHYPPHSWSALHKIQILLGDISRCRPSSYSCVLSPHLPIEVIPHVARGRTACSAMMGFDSDPPRCWERPPIRALSVKCDNRWLLGDLRCTNVENVPHFEAYSTFKEL